jgi:hypothetical protein
MADSKHRMSWLAVWMIVEVIALFLAFLSAGAGHGDYLYCKLLFPIPMYIAIVEGSIGIISAVPALVQYPLVGLAPFLLSFRRATYFYAVLAIVHIAFVAIVLMHPSTHFG